MPKGRPLSCWCPLEEFSKPIGDPTEWSMFHRNCFGRKKYFKRCTKAKYSPDTFRDTSKPRAFSQFIRFLLQSCSNDNPSFSVYMEHRCASNSRPLKLQVVSLSSLLLWAFATTLDPHVTPDGHGPEFPTLWFFICPTDTKH